MIKKVAISAERTISLHIAVEYKEDESVAKQKFAVEALFIYFLKIVC